MDFFYVTKIIMIYFRQPVEELRLSIKGQRHFVEERLDFPSELMIDKQQISER